MRTSPTMASPGAAVTQEKGSFVSDPRTRDRILSAVGTARRHALDGKASAVARACGHSEATESRIRSGEIMSATARAAMATYAHAAEEDARPLDAAGYASAYINATLNAHAMWPPLKKKTTKELRADLEQAQRQARVEAAKVAMLEAAQSNPRDVDPEELLRAHTRQATASERVMAILWELADR